MWYTMIALFLTQIFGISTEVYVIIILLALPIFFIWSTWSLIVLPRWQIIWSLTIVTAPIFYVVIVLIFFYISEYYPNKNFDQKQWFANKDERYEYSENIIESKILVGKTKTQVRQILGDEGNNDKDNDWYYDLGFRPEFANIDPDNLEITFKNGKVTAVIQNKR